MSYYKERLETLGVTERINRSLDRDGHEFPLFSEDSEGNIKIHYYTLQHGPYQYKKNKGNKWGHTYRRTRFKPGNEPKDKEGNVIKKYDQPKGSKLTPYFTPIIITAYEQKQSLETLYFVEGEFKALAGSLRGVPFVGLPGIHGFSESRSGEEKADNAPITLNQDILDLIEVCQVKNIVFLMDADAFILKYRKKKEMSTRPKNFFYAARNFRKVMSPLLKKEEYTVDSVSLAWIKDRHLETKGLDDLYFAESGNEGQISSDLVHMNVESEWFDFEDLTSEQKYEAYLKDLFGIISVQKFYKRYKKYLKGKTFEYEEGIFSGDDHGPTLVWHPDLSKYLRSGPKWYRREVSTDHNGHEKREVEPWSIQEIKRDHGHLPGWERYLPRYSGFTVEPDYTPNYREVVDGKFNLSNPLPHLPVPGSWKNIERFLKHIFRGEGTGTNDIEGDVFTVALDWLTIGLQRPKQKLPVIILVSEDNNTGKSTFLNLIQLMYGSANAEILDNESFKTNFNSHYAYKGWVMIDEGFLEFEKRSEKERMKHMVTSPTIQLQHKGVDNKTLPWYARMIMTSNDESRVMQIDESEDRWFIVKVNKIAQEDKDPNLVEKMKSEIPAFLHYLFNRQIFHPHVDRFWFASGLYRTAQQEDIIANTRTHLETNLREHIKEAFIELKDKEVYFDIKTLHEVMKPLSRNPPDINQVRRIVKNEWKMPTPTKTERVRMYVGLNIEGTPMTDQKSIRPYKFKARDFLSPEEYKTFIEPYGSQTKMTV